MVIVNNKPSFCFNINISFTNVNMYRSVEIRYSV